jgi:hypothetical protein
LTASITTADGRDKTSSNSAAVLISVGGCIGDLVNKTQKNSESFMPPTDRLRPTDKISVGVNLSVGEFFYKDLFGYGSSASGWLLVRL